MPINIFQIDFFPICDLLLKKKFCIEIPDQCSEYKLI